MIALLLMIVVVGIVVWFVTTYLPMPEPFKKAIYVISVLLLLVYVLNAFGLVGPMPRLR